MIVARQTGPCGSGAGTKFDPGTLGAFKEDIARACRPEFGDEQRAVRRDIAVKHPAPRQGCGKGGIDILDGQRQMVDPAMSRRRRVLMQLDPLIAKAQAVRRAIRTKPEDLRQLVSGGGGIADVQTGNKGGWHQATLSGSGPVRARLASKACRLGRRGMALSGWVGA